MASKLLCKKLTSRLEALSNTASRESILALSNWLSLNLNRPRNTDPLINTLKDAILNTASCPRKMLYLSLVHEMLIVPDDGADTSINSDLRIVIGEKLIIEVVPEIISDIASFTSEGKDLQEKMISKLNEMVRQWEEKDVFGGPTIIMEVKKFIEHSQKDATTSGGKMPISSIAKDKEGEIAAATAPNKAASKSGGKEEAEGTSSNVEGGGNAEITPKEDPTAVNKTDEGEFDFEKEGVAFGVVEPDEALVACKQIATTEITRALRQDAANRLGNILSKIPSDAKEDLRGLNLLIKEGVSTVEQISEDSLPELPEQVVNLDVKDSYNTIQQYRQSITQQQELKKNLLLLLTKCRCKFGADDSAREFYDLGEKLIQLKEKKGMLEDAMAIEGIDVMDEEVKEKEYAPLEWYKPSENDEKVAKKARQTYTNKY